MGQYFTPPDFPKIIGDIKTRISNLENTSGVQVYKTATRPAAPTLASGRIIFVSDAASGSRFQGWDGVAGAWTPLG